MLVRGATPSWPTARRRNSAASTSDSRPGAGPQPEPVSAGQAGTVEQGQHGDLSAAGHRALDPELGEVGELLRLVAAGLDRDAPAGNAVFLTGRDQPEIGRPQEHGELVAGRTSARRVVNPQAGEPQVRDVRDLQPAEVEHAGVIGHRHDAIGADHVHPHPPPVEKSAMEELRGETAAPLPLPPTAHGPAGSGSRGTGHRSCRGERPASSPAAADTDGRRGRGRCP